MSVLKTSVLKDNITIKRLLFVQFIAFVVLSLFLYLKQPAWFLPALAGGLTGWLPNLVFTLFTQHCLIQNSLTKETVSSAVSGAFFLAWIAKLLITVILLVIVTLVFKSEFIPVGLGFLSVIMMQFLAPVIVSCFYNVTFIDKLANKK